MLRLVADESLHGKIVRHVRRKLPHADFLSTVEARLRSVPDPEVLEWAAANGRIVVASDEETMINFAYDRVRAGLPMPGLIVARKNLGIGVAGEGLDLHD